VTPKDPAGEQPTATATSEDGVPIAIWASGSGRPPVNSTPEPSGLILGGIGFFFAGVTTWRRRKV